MGDKRLDKIMWFITAITSRCELLWKCHRFLSYDEARIAWTGAAPQGVKQLMRNKPISERFTMECLVDSAHKYVWTFQVLLQGSERGDVPIHERVIGLVRRLPTLYHVIVMDNLFTSARLLVDMLRLGQYAIGTLRGGPTGTPDNMRVPANAPKSSMKARVNGRLGFVSYVDSGAVSVMSTFISPVEVGTLPRWVGIEYLPMLGPFLLILYNAFMAGGDAVDQSLADKNSYRRKYKWSHAFFCWLVNICIHNALVLRNHDNPDDIWDMRTFREHLVYEIVYEQYKRKVDARGRHLDGDDDDDDSSDAGAAGAAAPPAKKTKAEREKDLWHIIVDGESRWARCQHCSGRTATRCRTCDVALHAKCFAAYHDALPES